MEPGEGTDSGSFSVNLKKKPWSLLPPDAVPCCEQSVHRPLWVCGRLGREFYTIPDGPNFINRERLLLLGFVDKLTTAIGKCERIVQTPVPLKYAIRYFTIWCLVSASEGWWRGEERQVQGKGGTCEPSPAGLLPSAVSATPNIDSYVKSITMS